MSLIWDITISMEQRTFGGFAKHYRQSAEEYTDINFTYILKNVSSDTIDEIKLYT